MTAGASAAGWPRSCTRATRRSWSRSSVRCWSAARERGDRMPTLLIVDDEQDNIDLLVRRLSWRGYEITGALSGPEAIAAARARRPDLILMDLKMPAMDGFEAIRLLKADEATRSIPIVALTAHALQEDMRRALEAGADGYETKPVNINQLLARIQALLPPPSAD